jgi:hypothetical protein
MYHVRDSSRLGAIVALSLAAGITAAATHGGGVIVTVIPGSSQQARKDQVCVSETAKIGDSFRNASGDLLTIKALSGKSAMCHKPDLRILASVEFSESTRFQSALTIELPEGSAQLDLTEKEKFDGMRMRLHNKTLSLGIKVQSWERQRNGRFDLKAFADKTRKSQAAGLTVAQTEIESLTVNGAPALRWEMETKPWSPIAMHATWITTVLAGDSEIVLVDIWGPTKSVTPTREKIRAVGESVVWQGKDATQSPAAMPPAVAPTAPAAPPPPS